MDCAEKLYEKTGNIDILTHQFRSEINRRIFNAGVIYTDRNPDALADSAYAAAVKKKIPMGNRGKPEDCCALIEMLCSKGASYITGQNIFMDGGMGIQ